MDFLLICKSVEVGGGEVPGEVQVIPDGFHRTPKGDFLADEESQALVMETFARRKNDMVVDYEHQTLAGVEAPAAGWSGRLINRGKDGVWAAVEWTEKAKGYIRAREYRYLSPVFLVRQSDKRVVELINVALTNQPNIDGMVPIVNKGLYEPSTNKKEAMRMKNLLAFLGLAGDATEEAAIEAVNRLKAAPQAVANRAVIDALGLKEVAGESEVIGTIMAMKQGHVQAHELGLKIAALEDRLRKKDAEEMVGLAMKDGKITADQRDWAAEYAGRDPEGFRVFAAKAPQVVPMGGPAAGGGNGGKTETDGVQLSVNRLLGISEETFRKHNHVE